MLEVKDLTLVSRQGLVVNQVSFHINAGEIVALTGKSGSGKTSIAMAILDLLPLDITRQEGSIHWNYEELSMTLPADSSSWTVLRGTYIAFTQQDVYGAFDPVLPVGKQMMYILQERARQPDAGLQKELLIKMEEVGLHDIQRLWASYPHQLSGGQLQRCQLAMAMVLKPFLLITDEPTSAIDKINQQELLDVFSMLRTKYNMAILCITHEEAVLRYLADREIRLEKITSDFALQGPQEIKNHHVDSPLVLEVKDLEYRHAFGGMMHRHGATIGKLNFNVRQGTCLGIIGESGSGKSTLAQLLVGLYIPRSGEVVVSGMPVDFLQSASINRLRANVQLVLQDGRGSLHPHFTIEKILQEIVAIRQKSEPGFTYSLVSALQEVELPESVLHRQPNQLSGGECLRVSFARALMVNPAVLICDESTSALDGETRDGILALLLRLKKEKGMAIIFISHDERVIRGLADEVLVLAEGKIVEHGSANQVIRFPTHPVSRKIFTMHATLEQRGTL